MRYYFKHSYCKDGGYSEWLPSMGTPYQQIAQPVIFRIGCDLICLKAIKNGKETTNSFDEFYKRSEAEAKSLVSPYSKFISTLKQEAPELYRDILSTFFPVDPDVVKNLKMLVNHFGIEKMKAYPSLFLATAFIRRKMGVNTSNPAVCGGDISCY